MKVAGVDIPQSVDDKYQRLERIIDDPSRCAEAHQLADELLVSLEAGAKQIARQGKRKVEGLIKIDLEPQMLKALDSFAALRGVDGRTKAVSVILHEALRGHQSLPAIERHGQ